MDDTTAALAGYTKKYNIPLSHFEHKYIQNCTDGKELERIYKELIGGEIGSFQDLEQLTLNRIRDIKPNSQILRKDKAPLDRSALPDEERQQLDDFLNQMKQKHRTSSIISKDHQNNGLDSVPIRSKSIISKTITPTTSAPVINSNGKQKRIVPRSYDEWGKLDQQLAEELNSDNEDDEVDDDEDDDNNNDKDEKTTNKSHPLNPIHEKSQRLHMAEQHRLNGNIAFKSNNYQQSIDLYTKSVMLDNTNPMAYMNRAIAYYKLNNYDASITDCSQILSTNPNHIKALFRRASCLIAKQQYDEAKRDLDILLTVDQENDEAKNLLKTIPTVQKTKGVRVPITEDDGDDEEEVNTQPSIAAPVKIPILEVEEEEEEEQEEQEQQKTTNESIQSMNIDIPQKSNIHSRPCIDPDEASPTMFDNHFQHCDNINQFQQNIHSQISSLDTGAIDNDDDDDDMALGDEASAGFTGNMSDDDGHISHNLNVSPTMDDDDPPELIDQKPLRTPPLTPPTKQIITSSTIDETTIYTINDNNNRKEFSAISNDDYNDLYDNNNTTTVSTTYSSYKQTSISSNPFETNDHFHNISTQQRSTITNSYNDQISNSNFSSTIQNWLRDSIKSQSNNRSSTFHDKLWSKSSRPSTLNCLYRDIQKYNGLNDVKNTTDASKKMLKNGVLDYHNHAEHIVSTLIICANCYLKANNYVHAIQYTSEALQYNKMDTDALICRARAFENEKNLLFSYADYARVPSTDYSHTLAQRACEKLAIELNKIEGKTWQEKLPKDNNDDERYLTYIKTKDEFSNKNQYDWYRERGNQLYLDACFVLAMQCYTYCIELKPEVASLYSNRAACYLKVFEPQKTIDDCNKALEIDPNNVRALYRKACAYKMSRNNQLYETTLKNLIKLQPNNQTVLAEYYTSRHEQIPRKMRRLRANLINTTTSKPSSSLSMSDMENSKSTIIIEENNNLSYEELEQIRIQKLPLFSANTLYEFGQKLNSLKSNDIKGQCSFILRLPTKGLCKITSSATSKLVQTIINACRIMVNAEKRYQQEHTSIILQFSYIKFCFDILLELTTLSRIDLELSMIDQHYRTSLNDLLSYYSSISSILHDVNKLDRLRK
ncbi:unnamed protein product [Rotaria sordida]|uniref:Uncharacterized protein n=1 Tax=Rotaria sordida TaxID=392033 RepID=A0A819CZB0_9BILA|nr:unnamed protein product [Rotaria sordida]CAF3815519.1 unnamed protein product [Rotaria sordida]